jgi:hypothetical protein
MNKELVKTAGNSISRPLYLVVVQKCLFTPTQVYRGTDVKIELL